MGILEDHDCVLELFNQLSKVLPTVKFLSRVYNLPCLEHRETEHVQKVKLIFNLLLRKSNWHDCLANEIRHMDRLPGPLLSDRLLILREPHMLVVLIGVEDHFILYHQYMLFFPTLKHWWDVLECFIIIACHQADQRIV